MDYSIGNRWRLRGVYIAVVLGIVFVQTLPLETGSLAWFSPDLVLAVTFAWTIRRPDAITPVLIGIIILLTDFILQRPPALWTLFVLAATLFLQSRRHDISETTFAGEWFLVALTIMVTFVAYAFALIVTFSGSQSLTLTATQASMTLLVYPVVTIVSQQLFGLYKPSAKDLNAKTRSA